MNYQLLDFEWLMWALLYANNAALAMWIGHDMPFVDRMAKRLREWDFFQKVVRRKNRPRWTVVGLLFGVSLLARLVMLFMGAYGYAGEYETVQSMSAYIQYLRLASNLGLLAIVPTALFVYSEDTGLSGLILLATLVGLEMFFGLLSGMKSAVVYPIIVLGFTYYISRERLPYRYVAVAIVGVFAAYLLVEPFRQRMQSGVGVEPRDAGALTQNFVSIGQESLQSDLSRQARNVTVPILTRQSFVVQAAAAVRAKAVGDIPGAERRFRYYMAMSPIMAVIPRAIWRSKPDPQVGRWYNNEILEAEAYTNSIGMTAVAYLYIAGGMVAVFVGFFCVGLLQRLWYRGFFFGGIGGIIIFVGSLTGLVKIPNGFYALPIDLIRDTVLLIPIQYLLYRE